MLTEEDRAQLVERIQRATAGRTWEDRMQIAEAWEFMASEIRRLSVEASRHPELPTPPPSQPRQLEMWLA